MNRIHGPWRVAGEDVLGMEETACVTISSWGKGCVCGDCKQV